MLAEPWERLPTLWQAFLVRKQMEFNPFLVLMHKCWRSCRELDRWWSLAMLGMASPVLCIIRWVRWVLSVCCNEQNVYSLCSMLCIFHTKQPCYPWWVSPAVLAVEPLHLLHLTSSATPVHRVAIFLLICCYLAGLLIWFCLAVLVKDVKNGQEEWAG